MTRAEQVVTCIIRWPRGCCWGLGRPGVALPQQLFLLASFLTAAEHGNVVWGIGTIKQTRARTEIGFVLPSQ